eukprot:CAMPEP_0181416320 /NCGR_PEP_ID=MMETSP1110-20121109/10461_1 /TAXON_ID=174948 /ORGANISM="Symbiodinium sp., Strain CCMP421" /LENGTH=173 /DNA_ID=CAMNT_0023539229 /DNA_START=249 /DNA_END=767 /DNA_ORIENTATION=+
MTEQTLPEFQIKPLAKPAKIWSVLSRGQDCCFWITFQYAVVTMMPATNAPTPNEGTAARPAISGGMNLKGTSTEPPNKPTAKADVMPAARSLPEPASDVSDSETAPVKRWAIVSQFTMIRAPAMSSAKAASVAGRLPSGAATSAGPMAPHAKDTKMAEQDQTACAVARPARGM